MMKVEVFKKMELVERPENDMLCQIEIRKDTNNKLFIYRRVYSHDNDYFTEIKPLNDFEKEIYNLNNVRVGA